MILKFTTVYTWVTKLILDLLARNHGYISVTNLGTVVAMETQPGILKEVRKF